MVQSTDGILVFGVDLGEDLPEFLKDIEGANCDEPFDAYLCQKAGIPMYGDEGYDYHAKVAFLKTQSLALITHCSGYYPMYILGVRSTYQGASRGSPQVAHMNVTLEERSALASLLLEHGIEAHAQPAWLLASLWD